MVGEIRVAMFGAAMIAVTAAAVVSAGAGEIFCTEPVAPLCVDLPETYQDELDVQRCKTDVEAFTKQMSEYLDCLAKQRDEAEQTGDDLIERFRCKVEGRADCE